MNFGIPSEISDYLSELDNFIENVILPMEQKDDNIRFFDHRREYARTNFENEGLPREEWEDLLKDAKIASDKAGHLRFGLPKKYNGKDGSNLAMAIIREHLAARGLGLHNDLQNEHSIVGNFPFVAMFDTFGTEAQQDEFINGQFDFSRKVTFGLTEPNHGSDATHMDTVAIPEQRDGVDGWLINGQKMWTTGMHVATHCALFCRTSGDAGSAKGITCLLVPTDTPGVKVEEYMWTFNMPTDHPRVSFTNVWVPESTVLGDPEFGLSLAQSFVHQNRIRQAAGSLGAAHYCVQESIKYSRKRKPFGKELAINQAIQFPMVELATQVEMLRLLIQKTAWEMDQMPHEEIEHKLSDKISMCNYWANRLVGQAADQAIQVHGAMGYSRHLPFEHIYRHHRRYRITEGSEEIQMRKVAAYLFGYKGPRREEFRDL